MTTYTTVLKHVNENSSKLKTYEAHYFSAEENRVIIAALENNTSVTVFKHIVYSHSSPIDEIISQQLPKMLSKNKGIKKLELVFPMTANFFISLAKSLSFNNTLTSLYLKLYDKDHHDLPLFTLGQNIKQNKSLKRVYLSGINCQSSKIMKIFCDDLLENSSLEALEFYRSRFNENGLFYLGDLFAKNKKIKSLVLHNCEFNDDAATYFASQFKEINRQKILVITKNPISLDGLQVLANAVINNPKIYIHYVKKDTDDTLFRFETKYISPHIKRDANKVLKSFKYFF